MSEQVRTMFAEIAPHYDSMNTILSFGIHHLWRKKAVRVSGAKPGMDVLDCATGTGDLAIEFKKNVGNGRVVGTDFCAEMLEFAPAKALKENVKVEFSVADAMNLPFKDNEFDISSISFGIRNVDVPVRALSEMARVVKPGGKVVVLEFGQPKGVFNILYKTYSKYIMPAIGSLFAKHRAAYEYLPQTAAKFPCREEFLKLMNETGSFKSAKYYPLTFGVAYLYVGEVSE
ncbi:MAG: bifunctional demethylmenaquinone methyltransferase/2-methoxy-6-polyprenyl-1,4-benzoquinol methylase UbiE [Bacteroidota bacterium]